jgi:REP element-mobilizing transposase RayT
VRRALVASSRTSFRVLQFTVQNDHLHLIVEADHGKALSGGVRGLAIRLARAVNRVLTRRGRVFADRYHARAIFAARGTSCPRLRLDELEEAFAHWHRARPVLVRCMVPWVE